MIDAELSGTEDNGNTWEKNPPFGGGRIFIFGKRNLSGENIGRLDQLVAQGPNRGLGAVINSQFIEDIDYMAFDGMRTDLQGLGDLHISGPLGYQAQNLQFPLGQNCRQEIIIFSRRSPAAGGQRSILIMQFKDAVEPAGVDVDGNRGHQIALFIMHRVDHLGGYRAAKSGAAFRAGFLGT